jgi:FecR protein
MTQKSPISVCVYKSAHASIFLAGCFTVALPALNAAPLEGARVSQVIQDVRLLTSNAGPRPAAVNDEVKRGTAVRTGTQSRAELTFADLTITRLGENTVFTLIEGAREVHVDSGSILLEVPPGGAAAKISSRVATAAITGGTGLFGMGPPAKFMVLEGVGTFYPVGHPELAVTLHGGEMIMLTPDGHLTHSQKFDVKTVVETSALIVDFPDLANLPLILQVIDEQQVVQSTPGASPPPSQDIIATISIAVTSNPDLSPPSPPPPPSPSPSPSPSPTGTPSKFGPPSTITSPNPYLITSGTSITTDPSITTNGVTDYGKLYRGTALDGSPTEFLFGEAPTSFDQQVLNGPQNNLPIAVFKFASLELTGDPTISVADGGATNLALVSIGGITSGGPGGILTFAGTPRVSFITQAGSITLGPEIAFSGLDHIEFYARGSGSNLTLASPISGGRVVHLFAEGNVQVNGNITVTDEFRSISGGDFLAGTGLITAANSIDVEANNDVTFNLNQFPEGANTGQDVIVDAGGNINIDTTGDQTVFSNASTISVTAANALNMTGANPTTLNLNVTSPAMFSAGPGGIQASTVAFSTTGGLDLQSGGDINVYAADIPFIGGGRTIEGSISATGAITTTGNVTSGDVTAGTSISVGAPPTALSFSGNAVLGSSSIVENGVQLEDRSAPNAVSGSADLFVVNATAGTTIDVTGQISAFGTIAAGGNITANGIDVENINAPNGVLSVGSNGITAFVVAPGGAAVQETFNVDSIISLNGIDYSGNQFDGIDGLSSGGKLTINARTITFDSEVGVGNTNFNGADAGAFSGGGPTAGGDGGIFVVNTTGDIVANPGADITATTGINPGSVNFSGAGGTVKLIASSGMVSVDDTIQVSSAEPNNTPGPHRASNSGGTILLQSNLTSGPGINIGPQAQLLSLLDANAPGPGGSITLSTMGADITIASGATIEADRGTITIDQSDPAATTPLITIDGGTLVSGTFLSTTAGDGTITFSNTSVRADIVKIGVFGSNGTLNIGGGTISANNLLQLYAPSSNGTLNFVANVTLSSGTAMNLAANTITIRPSVVVTIAGSGGPANVYTGFTSGVPNANYTGFGGNGSTSGTFAGNGANVPQPIANAPAFNPPPTSSSSNTTSTTSQPLSSANVTSSSKVNGGWGGAWQDESASGKQVSSVANKQLTTGGAINVSSSGQLLSLLNGAVRGPSGRVTIPVSNRTIQSGNSRRIKDAGQLKVSPDAEDAQRARNRTVINSAGDAADSGRAGVLQSPIKELLR